jgi:phosphoglycerate dehydrogenase-like enzyme
MSPRIFQIAVTPPAFCKSKFLRAELKKHFPQATFNEKDRYLTSPELIDFLKDKDAALIGRDIIGIKELKSLPQLRMISKYGVGLDNIDEVVLRKCNIRLGWTPGINKKSVAELTICFMLGMFHNIFSTGSDLKKGVWRKEGGQEISGKQIGVIGCGNVGREVIRMLKSFNTQIKVNDILDVSEFFNEQHITTASFEEVLESSDLITLHIPLTKLTRNLINKKTLEQMKSSAFLINTSRGEIIDHSALKRALQTNKIAGAALDVFNPEPPNDIELLSLPNLMGTPHIGGNAREAVEAMGKSAIDHLVQFLK